MHSTLHGEIRVMVDRSQYSTRRPVTAFLQFTRSLEQTRQMHSTLHGEIRVTVDRRQYSTRSCTERSLP